MLPPMLWVDSVSAQGHPGNLCTQAAHALRHTYSGLGLRSEILSVELAVTRPDGGGTLYGSSTPEYVDGGQVFRGHCVLHLPDLGRIIDTTVEQFPELARQRRGPLIMMEPTGLRGSFARLLTQRQDLTLEYTVVRDPEYAFAGYHGPNASAEAQDLFRANGMQFLSQLLAMTRVDEKTEARVRGARVPRVGELLDAIAGYSWDPTTGHGDRFRRPSGPTLHLRELVPAFDSSHPGFI